MRRLLLNLNDEDMKKPLIITSTDKLYCDDTETLWSILHNPDGSDNLEKGQNILLKIMNTFDIKYFNYVNSPYTYADGAHFPSSFGVTVGGNAGYYGYFNTMTIYLNGGNTGVGVRVADTEPYIYRWYIAGGDWYNSQYTVYPFTGSVFDV